MKIIEVTGKTVEEALKHALDELKLTKDKVDVEIINEGSKGLFNLIGTKPAKIKVTKKPEPIDNAKHQGRFRQGSNRQNQDRRRHAHTGAEADCQHGSDL